MAAASTGRYQLSENDRGREHVLALPLYGGTNGLNLQVRGPVCPYSTSHQRSRVTMSWRMLALAQGSWWQNAALYFAAVGNFVGTGRLDGVQRDRVHSTKVQRQEK
jgi:hypothetical protein